jgi:hypothetical protein
MKPLYYLFSGVTLLSAGVHAYAGEYLWTCAAILIALCWAGVAEQVT